MKETLRNRLTQRLSAWFPVLLLASLAMLTYWLDAQVRDSGRSDGTAGQEPDYFVEDLTATSYGKDGGVIQQLTARMLTHYPEGLPTQLVSPVLTDTQPGKPLTRVRADFGRVSPNNEDVYLTGNVLAEREASAAAGRISLATGYLHVQPKLQIADTDQHVRISDAMGTYEGGAMQANNASRTLKLRNGVSGEIRPASK